MPEFKLSKRYANKELVVQMAIDFDDEGNIINQEYWNGINWSEIPSDLRIYNSFCNSDDQDEWNIFYNDLMYLLESNEILNHLKPLKAKGDSYFFTDEDIEIELIEED
ncbi:hypothetical protein LJB96_02500 [Methanobrevibacter sp. OttesenSCG-928-K11]|nr:hypothetical protein [Methanobrevibacter sp. OttesenSCG-928-K11]MDL2270674.1 hypothetical protein [Methanobrevibacter sp. OttesenSCG-928-I08]